MTQLPWECGSTKKKRQICDIKATVISWMHVPLWWQRQDSGGGGGTLHHCASYKAQLHRYTQLTYTAPVLGKKETTFSCPSFLIMPRTKVKKCWVCVWRRSSRESAASVPVLGLPSLQSCEQNGLWNRQQRYRQTIERLEFITPPPSAAPFSCQSS